MEEIQAPKKERKFLKAVGNIAKVLANELVMGIARKFIGKAIDKVGNKRQGLVIASVILASTFAIAQYPATGNKQRLGYQTTGDGLVYRGRAADTVGIKSSGLNNAYFILDTVNNILYNYIKTKGGWKFSNGDTIIINGVTMPFDSITFNTAKDGTVGVGEVEYNDTQGSLIQGLKGGNVTNVIGQQLHQRVNNRTGATLTKGTAVYLSGSQGNRITVAKALGVTDAFSANTFGIVAESIANNQSGYVITEGLITNINTSALTEDSAVYLSPTVAGGLTSTKPQAPQHTVYIGVCVKSDAGSGELFVKIRNGQELDELHDVRITIPVDKASLYYKSSEKLWRDTTATLLVSDTASMLTPYFRDGDTTNLNLTSRFAGKLNISDTALMLTNYLRSGVASLTYTPLARSISTTSPLQGGGDLSTDRTLSILSASETQSGILNTTAQLIGGSKVFKHRLTADSLFFLNNTSPIPTAILGINLTGGVNSVGKFTLGNGLSITSSTLFADTNLLITMFDTASMLIPYFKDSDTTSLNLTSRFAAKLNLSDTASMLTNYLRTGVAASTYQAKLNGTGFVKASGTTISYDNSTYLTTGTAASTYLPLTGGTISGASSANNYTDTLLNVNYQYFGLPVFQNVAGIVTNVNTNGENAFGILSETSTIYKTAIGVKGKANLLATGGNGVAYGILGEITATAGGGSASNSYAGYFNNTSTVSDGNHYGLFVNTASGGDYGIYQTGAGVNYLGSNTSIGGTLGVTNATTLSAPLTVNSSAVFNEGSADADFRVESDGNANMVFVDASTDRVGIGTNAPTKTLEVNGEVKISTVTATPTALLGKDGSNVVGEVTTVAQTGLMTRGETTATTGSPSAIFTVTHGLGFNPSSVIITSAGIGGGDKILFEVYTKNSTTFSVQAWNLDGTEASSKSVKIYWLAIK